MSIRCGTCKGRHESVADVRACSTPPAPAVPRAPQALAEEGVYRWRGRIFRVVTKPNGKRMAEEMVGSAYVYAKGMVYRLGPADRLTLEQAVEWGHREIRCIRCATRLTKPESMAAGIGPVCITKI